MKKVKINERNIEGVCIDVRNYFI